MSTTQRPGTTVEINLTDKAVEQVRSFMEQQEVDPDTAGLRIAVLPGGCSGFQYGLEIQEQPQEDDIIVEQGGLRLFIDAFSGQYIQGAELDYVETMQASGFKFNNPNASGGCGCGESFSA